jgi:hypothetical protein
LVTFLAGLVVGLLVGAAIGVLVMAVLVASSRNGSGPGPQSR